MSKKILLTIALFSAAAATAGALLTRPKAATGLTREEAVARGRYLVNAGACNDCHTPWKMTDEGPKPDPTRLLSGHPETIAITESPTHTGPWGFSGSTTNTAWGGPWGVSFTANLTPDAETGLGTWTAEIFRDTIRNARHMGRGRPLLPPMPAPMYANLNDEDLGAIFAYLQSIPAIKNRVPQPLPPAAPPVAREPAEPAR
jgi:mono/diheme cytochrome c family protein